MNILIFRTLLTVAAGLLASCSLQSATPPKTTFQFGASRPAMTAANPRYGSLRVADFRAPQANRSANLIYRETDQRFVADPYRVFLAPPATLMAERTRAWLAASSLFRAVLPAGSLMRAETELEVEITELYADVREPKHPAAVLALRAWFSDDNGASLRSEWRFARRIALKQADAASVVAGFDQALEAALTDMEAKLAGQ